MNLYLACLIVVVSVGASVVWSNHRQLVSQAFALLALGVALWIYLFWTLKSPWSGNPVPWLRRIAAVGDLFPWLMWWLGRCAISPRGSWRDFFSAGRYWMFASLLLAGLALSPWFIPSESTPMHRLYGVGYLPHQIGQAFLFLALPTYAAIAASHLQGFARSMAKILFVGGGGTACLVTGFTALAPRLGHPELTHVAPVLASVFYVVGAWAISSQQLLDSRYYLLTVLRRAIGLIVVALAITFLLEREWSIPRELLTIAAAASGIMLALVFDSLSSFVFDRSLARGSFETARTLQRFTTDLAALPAAELHANAAQRLAETLATREVAVYWRASADRPLRLVSAHQIPENCPETLGEESPLLRQSERERAPWWLARRLPSIDAALAGFALCVPVLERGQVLLLLLTGHKRGPLGFTQQEISALQAWALACHHTLTTRALIERETAQQQLIYAGKLAAGIAHNIRNPLAIVRAYLDADPTVPRAQLGDLHDYAVKESARIQSIIDGLASLSRGERFHLSGHELDPLVRRAVKLNASYFAECRAVVEIVGATESLSALVEPWQFTTALTNLLRNSAEEVARDGGGSIRIEFAPVAAGWIEVRVRDSGRGLPAHIRDAVFTRELFAQTTKPTTTPGRRTGFGIGLHSTMLIVTIGHGGRFEYRDGAFVITLLAAPASTPGRE